MNVFFSIVIKLLRGVLLVSVWGTVLSFVFLMIDLFNFSCLECAHIVLIPAGDGSEQGWASWNDSLVLRFLGYEVAVLLGIVFYVVDRKIGEVDYSRGEL